MGWTTSLVRHRCARVEVLATTEPRGAFAMKIATLGIDLAKNAFQVHTVDERGQTVLRMADGGKPAVRARYI